MQSRSFCLAHVRDGTLGLFMALGVALSLPASAQTTSTSSGQNYPVKPVRLVAPFPAGGIFQASCRPEFFKLVVA